MMQKTGITKGDSFHLCQRTLIERRQIMTTSIDHTLLHDQRVNCTSIMTAMTVGDYIELVDSAYQKRGGLAHQRDALKTTTARRIRSRMVDDIVKGAVLPPVVVGVVANNDFITSIQKNSTADSLAAISSDYSEALSIIDGMQRTTALLEALDRERESVEGRPMRVEFWIADTTESLIYRMLVLNTGQVPWNLSRQLQVVYAPLIEEMKDLVKFERVLDTNAGERRSKAGEYAPDNLVELYIAFGLRKTDIDTQETLADEFSRLDMTEALSSHQYRDFFYPVVQMMVDLDKAFSRFDADIEAAIAAQVDDTAQKLKKGRSIFDSKPARIGFVVAAATTILGRVGMEQDDDPDATNARLAEIQSSLKALIDKLDGYGSDELQTFLKLDVLSERLYGQKRSAVGRYERAFFDSAFKVLFEEDFKVPSMEPCWRA
ncbi:MAG: hypothetical protein CML02_04390 [Pseudooceanicola sp.]|nr:hypothetical protein [Pseudooceanicola sp.]